MGNWQLIKKAAGTNLIVNPSFESTIPAGFTGVSGAAVSRSSDRALFGTYSAKAEPNNPGEGFAYSLGSLTGGTTYQFTGYLWAEVGIPAEGATVYSWIVQTAGGGTTYGSRSTITAAGAWELITVQITPALTETVELRVTIGNAGTSRQLYLDAVQLETADRPSTYIDGDREGCYWTGTDHNSTSVRLATAAGGEIYDLAEDFGFYVTNHPGAGMPPVTVALAEHAEQPGGVVTSHRLKPRTFMLAGYFKEGTVAEFHVTRRTLLQELAPTGSPLLLRYIGSKGARLINVYYDAGLELTNQLIDREILAIRFIAPDPLFYAENDQPKTLGTTGSANYKYFGGRVDGDWDGMPVPSSVLGSLTGVTSGVHAIAIDPSTKDVYIAGAFRDFDGIAAADNFLVYRWDKGDYETITGLAVDPVYSMVALGNDRLLLGTSAGVTYFDGTTETNYIANGAVYAVAVDQAGRWVAGGAFTVIDGVSAGYIARFEGGAWVELAGGVDDVVRAIAIDPTKLDIAGGVYIGGDFFQDGAAAVTLNGVAKLTLDLDDLYTSNTFTYAWDDLAGGLTNLPSSTSVKTLNFGPDGVLYVGGAFNADTNATVTVRSLAAYNGQAWLALGQGLSGDVTVALPLPEGGLLVSGTFAGAQGQYYANDETYRLAYYDPDRNELRPMPGLIMPSGGYCLTAEADPETGNVFVGTQFNSAFTLKEGSTPVRNEGNAPAFPVITISRAGGTLARVRDITNQTTGKRIKLNYALADGEALTLDLRPGRQRMYSPIRGDRWRVEAGSAIANFYLEPGINNIFIGFDKVGSPTIEAEIRLPSAFLSID